MFRCLGFRVQGLGHGPKCTRAPARKKIKKKKIDRFSGRGWFRSKGRKYPTQKIHEKFLQVSYWPSLMDAEKAFSRTCRCGRQFDSFGHHRAACSEAGVLGGRGYPLECAAAQVCREAGARVTTNVFIRDLDLAEFRGLDGRRIEVIADG